MFFERISHSNGPEFLSPCFIPLALGGCCLANLFVRHGALLVLRPLNTQPPIFLFIPTPIHLYPVKKDRLIRTLMLLAGFIAVAGILGSQSLFHEGLNKAKAATEQSADKQEAFIHAPGDAIPGHSVQVDDSSSFQEIISIFEAEEEPELPTVPARKIGQLFKVLFRTLIAPNAP
jgi:hypothetical protein